MTTYPVMIRMHGKKAVVIGGGKVAFRKVRSLLRSEADITIIAPDIHSEMEEWVQQGLLLWKQKRFEASDIGDAFVVIAATNSKEINQQVVENCNPLQLINVVDCPTLGNIHIPASFHRGSLTITVSTEGESPLLASHIRRQLEDWFPTDYEEYVAFLNTMRQWLKENVLEAEERNKYLMELLQPQYVESKQERESFQDEIRKRVIKTAIPQYTTDSQNHSRPATESISESRYRISRKHPHKNVISINRFFFHS